jgi:hypothetical protein
MEKKFGNCENGLSPYQAELLRQMECKSSHSFLANLQAGSTHWQGTDDTIICSTSWNNWAAKVAAKQGAVVDSVRAIQESKGNWAGIGRAKTGAVEEDKLEAPRRVVKETRPMPEQKSTRVIKASRSSPAPQLPPKASPKQGLPFAADEIAWPAAVSQ